MDGTIFLKTLYSISGVCIVGAYVPQAISAWKSKTGAKDVSILTWAMWCVTSTISTLYSMIIVNDLPYILVSLGNLLGCAAVVGFAGFRRLQMQRSIKTEINAPADESALPLTPPENVLTSSAP